MKRRDIFGKKSTQCVAVFLFLAVFLCLRIQGVKASDVQERTVYDYGELLTGSQEESLTEKTQGLCEKHHMNFIILTTADAGGKSAQEYADDFYMDQGFYDDGKKGGITMLIDMDNREVWLSTAGDMRYYVSDAEVEEILDAGYDYLTDGQMYQCFVSMLRMTDQIVDRGLSPEDYLIDENGNITRYHSIKLWEAVLALIGALAAAGIPCAVILGKYKVHFGGYAYNWRENSSITYREKQDRLVNQIVTHRHIPRNPPPSSGGHGGGGSSVHTSGGGGSFGGGGRSF